MWLFGILYESHISSPRSSGDVTLLTNSNRIEVGVANPNRATLVRLDLSFNELSGNSPPELRNLSELA